MKDDPSPTTLDVLFSPFQLGRLTLRNRIVSPPHGTQYANEGMVTRRQIAYYEARARGDLVLLATGSVPAKGGFSSHRPSVQAIPGWDRAHVLTSWDVLDERSPVGDHVVLVDDDPHGHAVNVAEYLAGAGKQVTLVCCAPTIGFAYGPANLLPIYRRLFLAGVRILEHTWVDRIDEGAIACSNVYSGSPIEVGPVDTVIMATGNLVNDRLYSELVAAYPELPVTRIGDCLAPRLLDDAIGDGHRVACAVS